MCLAIPGKVIKITDKNCTVDVLGVTRDVSIEFLKDVQVGDYVLIHAGAAIEKMKEEEAIQTIELFKELKEIW